eukprot:TRINITY_DN2944_c0_g1_i8.p1 TRINITY_DN2944_c0_g1~~TRINITY_DN2944_c0_g1_i8.p1  ORF type:complete len:273 (+),score=46.67 TRINITY_DN2944_c0_g1_i8:54-872(+)
MALAGPRPDEWCTEWLAAARAILGERTAAVMVGGASLFACGGVYITARLWDMTRGACALQLEAAPPPAAPVVTGRPWSVDLAAADEAPAQDASAAPTMPHRAYEAGNASWAALPPGAPATHRLCTEPLAPRPAEAAYHAAVLLQRVAPVTVCSNTGRLVLAAAADREAAAPIIRDLLTRARPAAAAQAGWMSARRDTPNAWQYYVHTATQQAAWHLSDVFAAADARAVAAFSARRAEAQAAAAVWAEDVPTSAEQTARHARFEKALTSCVSE